MSTARIAGIGTRRTRPFSAPPDPSSSIGGDNALAIELDGSGGAEKGRVRLVPIPAILAVDILEAVKADEEKRSEPPQSPAYFG